MEESKKAAGKKAANKAAPKAPPRVSRKAPTTAKVAPPPSVPIAEEIRRAAMDGSPEAAAIESRMERLEANPRARISPEERHRLIAETAYFRARLRGLGDAAEVEDWLAAEAEVDGKLIGES